MSKPTEKLLGADFCLVCPSFCRLCRLFLRFITVRFIILMSVCDYHCCRTFGHTHRVAPRLRRECRMSYKAFWAHVPIQRDATSPSRVQYCANEPCTTLSGAMRSIAPLFCGYSGHGYGGTCAVCRLVHLTLIPCCVVYLAMTPSGVQWASPAAKDYSEIIPGMLLTLLYQFTTSSGDSHAMLTVAET